ASCARIPTSSWSARSATRRLQESRSRPHVTGHFVLSTLHTNDPPRALTRLIDIGVEPHLASAAVTAVLNQRLVRRVCADCRQPVEASEEQLSAIGFSEAQIARGIAMYDSRGCDTCSDGFRGRVGVFQLMLV